MKQLIVILTSMMNTLNAHIHNPELSDDIVQAIMDLQIQLSELLDRIIKVP